jgi:hypothetical protein
MKPQHLVIVATALLACAPGAALAQPSTRPYQSLFANGSGDTNPAIHHKFDFSLSVLAAYDDDVLPGATGGLDPTTRPLSGYNTTYAGNAQYGWQGRHMQAGFSAQSTVRQYVRFNEYNASHSAAAGFAVQLPRRTSVFVNQTVAYSPPYLFGLYPSLQLPTPGMDDTGQANYVVDDTESLAYETIATVEHGLTRRSNVSVSTDYRFTDFRRNDTGRQDVRSSGISAEYAYSLGRNSALTAAYHYRSGELGFGSVAVTSEHRAEIGMAYNKRLSPSRRATFDFNIGSSRMDLPASPATGIVAGLHSSVSADAALSLEFARDWIVRAAYNRGAQFVAELTQPVFADGLTTALDGRISRRVRLMIAAAYSKGESFQLGENPDVLTYTGDAQLLCELTRMLSSYVEYLYYFYDFQGSTLLAPGMVKSAERNGVRAGLTLSFSFRRR